MGLSKHDAADLWDEIIVALPDWLVGRRPFLAPRRFLQFRLRLGRRLRLRRAATLLLLRRRNDGRLRDRLQLLWLSRRTKQPVDSLSNDVWVEPSTAA